MTRAEALEIALLCIAWRHNEASLIERKELARAQEILQAEMENSPDEDAPPPPLRAV